MSQAAIEAVSSLTEHERTVAVMLAGGLSVKQVAARLSRSQDTVETYRHRAYKKLGIKKVAQLAVVVTLAGLVTEWRAA